MKPTAGPNIAAKVFKRSGLLSLARLLQVGISFFIFWLFSIQLSKTDYGIYQKSFVLVSFLSGLCSLGLPVLIASLPATGASRQISMILKRFYIPYIIVFAAACIFTLFLANFIPFSARLIALLLIVCNGIYIPMEILLVKLNRDRYVLFNNIFYAVCYLATHWFMAVQPAFDLQLLLLYLLILSAARLLLILFSNRPHIQKDVASSSNTRNENIYIEQWKFLSLNEILDIISRQVDKLFLLWLLSAAAFAVYFNGSYEIPLIGILITTTGSFITMQTVQDQNSITTKELLQQSSLALAAILFPLFFFLYFNASGLFQVVFGGRYNDSVPVFIISCFIIPLRIMNYTAILQGYHKGKEILLGSLIGLITKLIVAVPLFFLWDVRGVALAFIVGTFVQIIYYLIKTTKALTSNFLNLLPFGKLLLLFSLAGTLVYFVGLLFNGPETILSICIKALISLLIAFTMLFLLLRGKKISI